MVMAITVEAAMHGKRVLWGAPTYDQVRVGWDEAKHAADNVANFKESRMVALFPNGGTILYRSLDDPDNARSHTADGVVMDECGDIASTAWHEVLRPMLIDTGGWAWGIGTPKGLNWFWTEHQRARDRADSIAWQAPTLGVTITEHGLIRSPHPLENPCIPFAELQQMFETMPRQIFEQEIMAAFVENTGAVFRGIREAVTATAQHAAQSDHAYVIGCDWGKLNDFTALAVLDLTDKALVHLDRSNQIDYHVQTQRLQALCQRFHPALVIAERNAMGEPILEQLQRLGLPVWGWTATNATKVRVIEDLALAFEQRTLRILDDPILIGELQAYSADKLPSGLVRYSATEGMHDDCVMALALAWQGKGQAATPASTTINLNNQPDKVKWKW